MAGDFAEEGDGKYKKKGGEIRCRLEELGLAGVVVGAEASAEVGEEVLAEVGVEALVGATLMPGVGLGMARLTVILMEDTDLATPAMVTVQHRPMATTHGKSV
jgi:hypothetical protein